MSEILTEDTLLPVTTDEKGVERLQMPLVESNLKPVSPMMNTVMHWADSENFWMQTAKDLFSSVEMVPTIIGSTNRLLGEGIKIMAAPKEVGLPPFTAKVPDEIRNELMKSWVYRYGDILSQAGLQFNKFFIDAANKGMESPNPAILSGWTHPFKKTVSLASRNAGMLALAAGATVASGGIAGPTMAGFIGGSIFFPVVADDLYEDAIGHGVEPEKAMRLAIATGTFQTVTEGLVLGNWMRGGNIIKRIARTALQEGVEELSQQIFDNALRTAGWDDGRPVMDRILDGVAESIAAGTLMGGVLGGFAPPNIEDVRFDIHQDIIKDGIKNNISSENIQEGLNAVDKFIDTLRDGPAKPKVVTDESGNPVVLNSQNIEEQPVGNVLAMAEQGAEGATGGEQALGRKKKIVPDVKAKMEFERRVEAWRIRDRETIEKTFEKHIGPELQISSRLKRWLGFYSPMAGVNGVIKVRSLDDLKTLYHETGHFLDDALGKIDVKRNKIIRQELVNVSKSVTPWKEEYIVGVSEKTGKPTRRQTSKTAYWKSRPELVAQYVAAYVMDPQSCKVLAPSFTAQVESTIGQDREWNYIIDKLHQYKEMMQPMVDGLNALRKMPEINPLLNDWVEQGNPMQMQYRRQLGDLMWNKFRTAVDKLGENKVAKAFLERGGLNSVIFEILRQRRKLIAGQIQRLQETITEPLSKQTAEAQQYVAEHLQLFEKLPPDNELNILTEKAREEFLLWGYEAKKLGLLNDSAFWNNYGQYFPFFYTTKEFEKNKKNLTIVTPSKVIKANFDAFKQKGTDFEWGMHALRSHYGNGKVANEIISQFTREEVEDLGYQAKEKMGLIKTAAYPVHKRVSQLIEAVYTVKAFNMISEMPGIIGTRETPGFDRMPESKKFGELSGEYVPEALVAEVKKWTNVRSEFVKTIEKMNSIWKIMKVPYNPAAVFRNVITNAIMAYFGDIPIWDPRVSMRGAQSFLNKDEVYSALRDYGMYKNSYSSQELQDLVLQLQDTKASTQGAIIQWAHNLAQSKGLDMAMAPARFYGAVEDASKTIIARYVLDQGGTALQAAKFADKLLFDYSQTSEVTGLARKSFLPFITWSMKVLPVLVETAIRKPEKYAMIVGLVWTLNGIAQAMLGINSDDEDKLKPDYIKGKLVMLMPWRDNNGDLNWLDLTNYLPWGSWMPVENGKLASPQAFTMSSPIFTAYNAFVLNYDPFYGQIAPTYLPDAEQTQMKWAYMFKNLGPNIMFTSPGKIIKAIKKDKYGREGVSVGQALLGELTGVKMTRDISAVEGVIKTSTKQQFAMAKTYVRKQLDAGEISREEYDNKIKKIKADFENKMRSLP